MKRSNWKKRRRNDKDARNAAQSQMTENDSGVRDDNMVIGCENCAESFGI